MAVVTVRVRKVKANTPGRWASDLWFYGINQKVPRPSDIFVNITDGPIFEMPTNSGKPDDMAMRIQHLYGMGIINRRDARRIVDLGWVVMAMVTIAIRRVPLDYSNELSLAMWMLWLVRPNLTDDVDEMMVSNDGSWMVEKELARGTMFRDSFMWHADMDPWAVTRV